MVLEVINKDQQVRRAGLRPRTAYTRIINLELTTLMGSGQLDSIESNVLSSEGLIHNIEIHAHGQTQVTAQSAWIWIGLNLLKMPTDSTSAEFRQSLIENVGGRPGSIRLASFDDYADIPMLVKFLGDKTRLAAVVQSFNNFTTEYQVIFTISEG